MAAIATAIAIRIHGKGLDASCCLVVVPDATAADDEVD
jgi:hypothetical protein